MTRYHKALCVFLVTVFGLWGCARGPEATSAASATTATNEKIKLLEAKINRLEEDLKIVVAAKGQLCQQLADAEQARTVMQQEIDRLLVVEKERNVLKVDLRTRTVERDQLQAQYETFRNSLKELLGQAETTLRRGQSNVGLASHGVGGTEN